MVRFFLTTLLDTHFDVQAVVVCKYGCCVVFFAKVDRENSALSAVCLVKSSSFLFILF